MLTVTQIEKRILDGKCTLREKVGGFFVYTAKQWTDYSFRRKESVSRLYE